MSGWCGVRLSDSGQFGRDMNQGFDRFRGRSSRLDGGRRTRRILCSLRWSLSVTITELD